MQWVGKTCDVCAKRVSSELDVVACVACEVVIHGHCASVVCPRCGAALATRDDLAEPPAAVGEDEHRSEVDDDEDLAAEHARGRSVLWSCVLMYLGVSLSIAVPLLLASGDFLQFGAAVVRWLITLEGARRIARGSVLVAKIAIGLAVFGGVTGLAIAARNATLSTLGIAAIFGITSFVIAGRLALSSAFWAYVRAQKRFYEARNAEYERPAGERRP